MRSSEKPFLGRISFFVLFSLLAFFLAGCTLQTGEVPSKSTAVPLPAAPVETAGTLPTENTDEPEVKEMKLTSSAFEDNGEISTKYVYKFGSQCNGENFSPPFTWTQAPENSQTLFLTMIDPDGGDWVHWLLFNIPPEVTSLEEVIGGPKTGVQGRNDFGKLGYGGPCPPSGTHRYVFTLYALDIRLDIEEDASLKSVLELVEGHVLAQSSLTGIRSK